MRLQSLGWEDPLEEHMATHSSILAWRIPHGQRNLAGYRPQGGTESDTTEAAQYAIHSCFPMLCQFLLYSRMSQALLFLVFKSCPTFWDLMNCSTPGSSFSTISQSLLKLMYFESVMLFNHLILCCLLLLLTSIFPSIRVFPNESAIRIRWPKYLSFQLQPQSF